MLHLPQFLRRHQPSAPTAVLVGALALAAVGLARTQTTQPPPGGQQLPTRTVSVGSGATADSNNRMIAVTGVDVTGSSVLYVVDTEKMRLAIYQATSTGSNQGIRLVGARRIELDMELDGYNDKSDYTYRQLKDEFGKKGLIQSGGAEASSQPSGN